MEEIKAAWERGKPFYLTGTVHSPYSGCFYEPNIWLVTPIGCDLQSTLMSDIPSRYDPIRETFSKKYEDLRMRHQYALGAVKHAWSDFINANSYSWNRPFTDEMRESLCTLFDKWMELDDSINIMRCEMADIAQQYPAMKQPELCVWPLYASGQGIGLDAIHSLSDLLEVVLDEDASSLADRESWPFALDGTRYGSEMGSHSSGRIDSWEVGSFDEPINNASFAGERYWMKALEVASSEYGLYLTWECSQCSAAIEFSGDGEGQPEPTGYHGGGGICIHYTDVMCDECAREGMCQVCSDAGCTVLEAYDPNVADKGWSLCEYCTEKLLASSGLVGEVDLPDTVELLWYRAKPTDVARLCFCIEDTPIEELSFDENAVIQAADAMSIEHLEQTYAHIYAGISLPGNTVENIAYNNLD